MAMRNGAGRSGATDRPCALEVNKLKMVFIYCQDSQAVEFISSKQTVAVTNCGAGSLKAGDFGSNRPPTMDISFGAPRPLGLWANFTRKDGR
jgi:hypothetical protein